MSAVSGPAPDCGGRPAVSVTGLPPEADQDYLDLYFGRYGDLKEVHLTEDGSTAYIEYTNPSDSIPKVLSKTDHKIRKCPVSVEETDLLQIMQPYLIIKGFPPFANKALLTHHFQKAAGGVALQSVEMKGSEAEIFFADPAVTLKLASEKQVLMGKELEVTVGYSSPQPQEECVLAITGLSEVPLDADTLGQALTFYFKQPSNGGHEILSCSISNGTAYVQFTESSKVREVVSQPPTGEFMAGVHLEMKAVPKSQVPGAKPETSPPINIPTAQQEVAQNPSQFAVPQGPSPSQIPSQFAPPYGQGPTPPQFPGGSSPQSPSSSWPSGTWATQVQHSHSASVQQSGTSSLGASILKGQRPPPGTNRPPQQSMMVVEDLDTPFASDQQLLADGIIPNKVIVEGFPPNTEEYILQLYMNNLAQIDCTEFQIYGELAVATFQSPLDFNVLQQRSNGNPFPKNKQPLAIKPFKATTSIMVSNIPPSTPDFAIMMYFQTLVQQKEISSVKLVPPSQALVTFTNHQCVQKVIRTPQHSLGQHAISVREYYQFSESSSLSQPAEQISNESSVTSPTLSVTPPAPVPLGTHKWFSLKRRMSSHEYSVLKQTQSELNSELESTGASASIEKDGDANYLNVSPLPAASSIPDWDDKVSAILHEHFALFKEDKCIFPHDAKADILEYLVSIKEPELEVRTEGDTVTLSGKKAAVEEAMEKIATMCEEMQVVSSDFHMKRRHIKYVLKFCQRDLQEFSSKVKYDVDEGEEKIVITGTSKEIDGFKDLVSQKVASSKEKNYKLSSEAFQLLTSQSGQKKMNEALGMVISKVVYDLEVVPSASGMADHLFHVLALEKESCKRVMNVVKSYTDRNVIRINSRELAICKTPEWKKFVGDVTAEFLSSIEVTADLIVITGESIAINDIGDKVRQFLEAKTSVGDVVKYGGSEWRVISSALRNDLDQIKQASKRRGIRITEPKGTTVGSVTLEINGEPSAVDDIKQQLIMLGGKVEVREARVAQVPGLEKVLESAEDKIKGFEHKHKAVIEIDVESGENGALKNQPPEELPRKLCTATLSDDIRVSIFSGNFTLQRGVGTIINFLLPNNHNFQEGSLKMLLDAGGTGFDGELQSRLSQCLALNPPACIRSNIGSLKCDQLLHCVVPKWNGGAQNEADLLQESLEQSLQKANPYASILITAATASPFNYPAKVFAEKVVSVLTGTLLNQTTDIQVSIFVNDISELQSFEECLRENDFQVSPSTKSQVQVQSQPLPGLKPPRVVSSARSLTSGISSFITVTQGDMLKEQADVYINSTNENLNLSQGQLSQTLLKTCGQELQDECSQYAPLQPGGIAVTAAKNLPCKHIVHVVLPDHKTKNSERIFREAVKAILRAAADEGASSIAIPSLGVANLRYPPALSAKILFEEVIEFHTRTPAPIRKFHFVIYKKEDYHAFNKEYVQCLSNAQPAAVKQHSVSSTPSISTNKHKGTQLLVVKGNIADESTDIIVNTTRDDMDLSAGAVSKAILQKAGPKLQSTCTSMIDSGLKLDKGNIVETPACGQLRCKKVLHAHIPPHGTASIDTDTFIEKVVIDCLKKAEAGGHKSISFPVFGIGGGGYSIDKAGRPMLEAFQKFSKTVPKSVKIIRILVIDDKNYDSFCSLFSIFFNLGATSQSYFQSFLSTLGLGRETCIGLSLSSAVSVRGPSHLASGMVRSIHNPIAVFRIFAASSQLADQIETEIRQCIKAKIAKETVKDEHIASLLEDDIAEIVALQDELGISIRVIVRMKQIIIEGEVGNVSKARSRITDMMREIDQAEAELKEFDWQTCDEDNDMELYPYEAAIRLERAMRKKRHQVAMVIDNVEVIIDLKKLEETSKVTGKKRKVVREKKTHGVELPPTWENQPIEGDKPKTCHLFDVPSSSIEFTKAIKEFESKMGNLKFTVVSVQRVQNPNMYSCHVALRESMRKKYHQKAVEERRLFHGTKTDSVDAITHQGFNRNFAADANAAHFGRGAYFAVNAWYSAQEKYSVPEKPTGNQYMFVCNVLVGSFTKGTRDMKVAPDLPDRPRVPYDTLVDNIDNPTIFVAMTDYQAYPEYLIAFKITK